MKCTIPEIAWHNRDPVLSIDIQKKEKDYYRLASGGTDCIVLIWQLKIQENGAVSQEVLSELTRHQKSVNVVRWSPSGKYLASGDDDANIIIWVLKTDNVPSLDGENEKANKEIWNSYKVLRGHKEDIYDICWSPDETKLLSGSIDNSAILWNFVKGKFEIILKDHKGFVQGCAWDPKGQYLATLSSDRLCRIFDISGKQVKARIYKGKLPVSENNNLYNKDVKYFHDDTYKSYFRRLQFSPDGNLLITPTGCVESEEDKKALYATYIFARDSLSQPAVILPAPKQCSTAIRCSPILYELNSGGPDPYINLPYRMIIAIATDSDILLYDTQQLAPFAVLQNIHYTRLTDLTWSDDGLLLAASSTDGYCTLITFEPSELGVEYVKEDIEADESQFNLSGIAELDLEETEKKEDITEKEKEAVIIETKPKKPTILDQWTIKTPKRVSKALEISPIVKKPKENEIIEIEDSPVKINNSEKKVPKHIVPIKIDDVTSSKKQKLDTSECSTNEKVINKKSKSNEANTNSQKANSAKVNTPKANTAKVNSPKTNPLMKFLKSATPVKPKIKKEGNILSNVEKTGSCEIIEIEDEDEARDSWKIQRNPNVIIANSTDPSKSILHDKTMTDVPEDFSLALDDSYTEPSQPNGGNDSIKKSPAIKNVESPTKAKVQNNTGKSNQEKQDNQEKKPRRVPLITLSSTCDPKLKKDAVPMVIDDVENKITKDLDKLCEDIAKSDSTQSTQNDVHKDIPKTPRRVPLITLSSPRHKKKKSE